MAKAKTPGDYEVGYGKPPKHSQFKLGNSGNPVGKQKGTKSLKTVLTKALGAKMTIGINGEMVTASRQHLMMQTLTSRAAAGDLRAAKVVLDLIQNIYGVDDADAGRPALSAQDQQLLDDLLAQLDDVSAGPDAPDDKSQIVKVDDQPDAGGGLGERP